MLKLLFIVPGLFFQYTLQSQDFISVRKKNGRVIKQFTTGSFVTLEKKGKQRIEGLILNIQNDSLWIKRHQAPVSTLSSATITADAFNALSITAIHYKDIYRLKIYNKERFLSSNAEKIAWVAGSGLTIFGMINGSYLKQPIVNPGITNAISIGILAADAGFSIRKYFRINTFSKRHHRIVYVKPK